MLEFDERLLAAVDLIPETRGWGVIVDGHPLAVADWRLRGPVQVRRPLTARHGWVLLARAVNGEFRQEEDFWGTWGDTILSCGSFGFSLAGTVVTGGGLSPALVVTGANCAIAVGKRVFHEEFEEFKRNGGYAYTAWLTLEAFLVAVDVVGGGKDLLKFLKQLRGHQLSRLIAAVKARRLSRAEMIAILRKVEPGFRPLNARLVGSGYASNRALLRAMAARVLTEQRAELVAKALGGTLTGLGGIRYGAELVK